MLISDKPVRDCAEVFELFGFGDTDGAIVEVPVKSYVFDDVREGDVLGRLPRDA